MHNNLKETSVLISAITGIALSKVHDTHLKREREKRDVILIISQMSSPTEPAISLECNSVPNTFAMHSY